MKKVDKLTLLLLSIFLGGLGIDHFMTGKTVTGLLKLFTGGGFGVWTIIDVIMIATDNFKCGPGYYIE